MMPLTRDFAEELANIDASILMRWAQALKGADQFDMAEVVFPDTPECELEPEELAA